MYNEQSQDDFLHIAVSLNHAEHARCVLSRDIDTLWRVDQNGDYPAHIAARMGHIETLVVLIEFDAPMEAKNFASLTPLGEACMNNQFDVIRLLKENYIFRTSQSSKISEFSPERYVYRKLSTCNIPSQTALRAMDRKRRLQEKESVRAVRQSPKRHAFILQAFFKRLITRRLLERGVAREQLSALRIQCWWKNRFLIRVKIQAATMIQTFFRSGEVRSNYKNFLKDRLITFKRIHSLVIIVQKLWRGHLGRRHFRKMIEMKFLPDPRNSANFTEWLKIQHYSHPPARQCGIYAEYILSGIPRTWAERRIKRNSVYYRDVKFWVNIITRQSFWKQPEACSKYDRQGIDSREFMNKKNGAVMKIANWWKVLFSRRSLNLILKANRLINSAEVSLQSNTYKENDLYNYTLYVHVILQDYDRARSLYERSLAYMQSKGRDNGFLLYSFAIFVTATGEEDIDITKRLIQRAQVAEHNWRETYGYGIRRSIYDVANRGLFRFYAEQSSSGEGWHLYALCRMLVYNDIDGSRLAFLKAIKMSPHSRSIQTNFSFLLQDKEYLGKRRPTNWDLSDELRDEQSREPSCTQNNYFG